MKGRTEGKRYRRWSSWLYPQTPECDCILSSLDPFLQEIVDRQAEKKTGGQRCEAGETASQRPDFKYVQGQMYDDRGIPSTMRANRSMNDGFQT